MSYLEWFLVRIVTGIPRKMKLDKLERIIKIYIFNKTSNLENLLRVCFS